MESDSQPEVNRGHREGIEGNVLLCVSIERKFTQLPLYQFDKLKDFQKAFKLFRHFMKNHRFIAPPFLLSTQNLLRYLTSASNKTNLP